MAALIVVAWVLIGIVAALTIGMAIAPAFGFPQMEGSSAIFAVLIAGPIGAILGGLVGLTLMRKYAADPQKQKAVAAGSWLVIVALAIGTPFSGGGGDYLSSGSESSIAYQIRLPASAVLPADKSDVLVELRSDKETRRAMYAGLNLVRDGERPLIQGYIEFNRVTPNRTIAMRVGNGPTHLFRLTIPARPKSSPGSYESWFPVTQIDDNVAGRAPRAPRPDEISEIRHFVTIRD